MLNLFVDHSAHEMHKIKTVFHMVNLQSSKILQLFLHYFHCCLFLIFWEIFGRINLSFDDI
jgi:hypothetical protein